VIFSEMTSCGHLHRDGDYANHAWMEANVVEMETLRDSRRDAGFSGDVALLEFYGTCAIRRRLF